jgi:hypothetical protein
MTSTWPTESRSCSAKAAGVGGCPFGPRTAQAIDRQVKPGEDRAAR